MITETRQSMDGLKHEVRETVKNEWRRYVRDSREEDPEIDIEDLREEFYEIVSEIADGVVPLLNSNILYAASSDAEVAFMDDHDGMGYDPLTQIRMNIGMVLDEVAHETPLAQDPEQVW